MNDVDIYPAVLRSVKDHDQPKTDNKCYEYELYQF